EICLNSIDADGTRDGYELTITSRLSRDLGIPVIASGGAGNPDHIYEVLTSGKADAALIASMVHFDTYTIGGIKEHVAGRGVHMRLNW
ncbi:MAG: HisA/HisF-related TIM barrel protein, partial [Planctomycetota bacterium]|nr:HisA/HisF-related TIM barrel protein [Planctomycetota bacterium]